MIKSEFENLELDFWVHFGKLGRARPSLCLFHRELETGRPLLVALEELLHATSPAQRTLTFAECSRKRAIRKLTLQVVPVRDELKVMSIRREEAWATIEMTSDGLPLVIDAVQAWLAGGEDFGVSPEHAELPRKQLGALDRESGELWFWGPGYYAP